MNKKTIRKSALETRKQIGEITYHKLVLHIAQLGYEVVYDTQEQLDVVAATDFENHKIYVSTKINETLAVKLLLHELAHIILTKDVLAVSLAGVLFKMLRQCCSLIFDVVYRQHGGHQCRNRRKSVFAFSDKKHYCFRRNLCLCRYCQQTRH